MVLYQVATQDLSSLPNTYLILTRFVLSIYQICAWYLLDTYHIPSMSYVLGTVLSIATCG